ncbi:MULTISPECIES: DeoR/GlpR family DNA-binding transcription regulator [Erwinia]|uniref:GntR family transcriptional regulator n=2 Tax=Erwinia rhapontici TaxID=55212 RepID=A0ABM7MUW2_ERWRD|nr:MULTISPECIES: DeoR/GlpR family DNA-binding transcription regulator [Erwinia]MBP2153579.1 DeoR/GlpR family transcriptional regulator of sugar metabolism [Erwinia rhapontici]MCS3608646.1 DeoR/GlpR family transcriptional regulator of sugar metabolism [Erwinia rhapontici]NKG31226.1 DeoR/GlpR transcriptional regulator [Erwinia rhapontici]NNS08880.1 DeoR/GlpR transcriptional regulator [Erwinia sp. JH02]TDS98763.1 DeoR family transcriptional regulator [Erwinia rhapontici]
MSASKRRLQIIEMIREKGYLNAVELSEVFGVDSSTIRRDLSLLEKNGMVMRTHGGLLPVSGVTESSLDTPYSVRRQMNNPAKAAIARYAASLVQDGQSLILDNGSSVYELALALRDKRNLTVVTNDVLTAVALSACPGITIHVTGGMMLNAVYTLIGQETVDKINSLHVDWAFLGAEGVHFDSGITNINTVEIPVKKAMIAAAEKTVVLVDSSKMGYRALAHVCPLAEIALIITEESPALKQRTKYGDRLRVVTLA